MRTSRLPGFYRLGPEERLRIVKEFSGLSEEEAKLIGGMMGLGLEQADRMVENVIGGFCHPLGIAVNFLINGRDYLIPMAIEEPSVIAAASNAARLAREAGGFEAWAGEPLMIGQIQLVGIDDPEGAIDRLMESKQEIIERANSMDRVLISLGGGARDLRAKILETPRGRMLIAELVVDVRDAMGANIVNTMAEAVAPMIEGLVGGRARLRIVSNLATERMAGARAVFRRDVVGRDTVDGVLDAYEFARADPYRCATHNKGIMNGIVAVATATGQDTRAIEAGAHAYAGMGEGYRPLTRWGMNRDGDLVGEIELPLAVGVVGGATRSNPIARVCLKILGVKGSRELAMVMASVGLAQNFAALRALSTEGIQKGHMKLHARNLAIMAGASGELIDLIAERMVSEGRVSYDRARELIEEYRAV